MYDFDATVDRHNTDSLKFDLHKRRGKRSDLLPLWVADMDFKLPDEVLSSVLQRAQHGVFGYTEPADTHYFEAVRDWMKAKYNWDVKLSWLVKTPGIVFALAAAVRAYTKPGDGVLITQPVYYPFSEVIVDNDRHVVNCSLIYDSKSCTYDIDFEAFEEAAARDEVKLFLLCNPHNPGGRVWTADELRRLGEICNKHGVVVLSDEIHQDFARPGYSHVVYADLGEEFKQNCVVCTSPGKTFNIAGLQDSNIFIPNKELRQAFSKAKNAAGYSQMNTFALVAGEACYRHGDAWLTELKEYLEGNLALIRERLADDLSQLKLMEPGSTYLAWIDCRALGQSDDELIDLIENKAHLWLDTGEMFGADGSGFIRINYATQRSVVAQCMDQLAAAINN